MSAYRCRCVRCGAEAEWSDCERCDGTGETEPGELYDEDPLWYDQDDTEPCHQCGGAGGWWFCPETSEWCEAHPMLGREGVKAGAFEQIKPSPSSPRDSAGAPEGDGANEGGDRKERT